jgi:hypothetical protein
MTFDAMKGKTVEEVGIKGFCLRIIFTDGSFVDLDVEDIQPLRSSLIKARAAGLNLITDPLIPYRSSFIAYRLSLFAAHASLITNH